MASCRPLWHCKERPLISSGRLLANDIDEFMKTGFIDVSLATFTYFTTNNTF